MSTPTFGAGHGAYGRPRDVRPPIFDAVREAMSNAVANFEPTNESGELAAGAVRQLMAELSELSEHMGECVHIAGQKCVDQIYLTPGAGDAVMQMARYLGAPARDVADAAALLDREHDDDVRRLHLDVAGVEAWDYGPNRR